MFVEICSAPDTFRAELLKDLLEENGFHPNEISVVGHLYIAGVDHAYFVEVPEAEAAEARKCLMENGQGATIL